MENRKEYIKLNENLFEQIKRLLPNESINKIIEITSLGRSQIYKIKKFVKTNEDNSYADFAKKKGEK